MKNIKKKNGFTFIEAVASMAFLAGAVMVLYILAELTIDLKNVKNTEVALQAEASEACYRFSRDARAMKKIGGLIAALAQEVEIMNIDDVSVRYWLSDDNLMRGNSVLVEGVTDVQFVYYDDQNNVLAWPMFGAGLETNVALIEMKVTVSKNNETLSLQARGRPRNI